MTRYKILPNAKLGFNDKIFVHALNPLEKNFTICTVALYDEFTELIDDNSSEKINCPFCTQFINYCKSFKENDLKKK